MILLSWDGFGQMDCEDYWVRRDSTEAVKADYFHKNVLEAAMTDPSVPAENLAFVKDIADFLDTDWETQARMPAMEMPLNAVFKIVPGGFGFVKTPRYKCLKGISGRDSVCPDITWEHKLLSEKTDLWKRSQATDSIIFYPDLFEQKIGKGEIYLLGLERTQLAEIVNFGAVVDECLEFYHYELSEVPGYPLIATQRAIIVEFTTDELLERQFARNFNADCFDCQFEYEPQKTFARLAGVPALYFTYTDTLDPSNQFMYPGRSLVMKMNNGTFAVLWSDSIDLFGCACL